MKPQSIKALFQPEGRAVHVLPGTSVAEAAARAGIVLEMPCGGTGTCGKCRVQMQPTPPPTEAERKHLTERQLADGWRLACQRKIESEVTVAAPSVARYFDHKILLNGQGRPVTLHPTVSKQHIILTEPALEDQRADVDRFQAALEERLEIDLATLRKLPSALRASHFNCTAVAAEGALIAVEPGDTTARNFGMAFDIGTTTVVGFLLNLAEGRELAVASRANPQIRYGDDVVSRIHHAQTEEGLHGLQRTIVTCLNDIIADCCESAGVSPDNIYEAAIAANTTMSHLLLGIPPRFIAEAPYVAAVRNAVNAPARDLELSIHPNGIAHVLPNIAGFVGSDTVAVVLASGMHEKDDLTLAIDIGTNGELVIGNRKRLLACSTAAGPAFEGARIRFGMRAAEGAIDKIIVEDDIVYNVIGNAPPRGICGTALIDAVADLLRLGMMDSTGRLLAPDAMPSSVPEALKRRVIQEKGGMAVVLVPESESATGEAILLTQRDVRELQLAKGAIAAGTAMLIKEFGATLEDIQHILLAGAFGNFIRPKNALRIGLLPKFPEERILYIGNAAGAGARMALQSRKCKETANTISERTEYLELAGRPEFQEAFADAMLF